MSMNLTPILELNYKRILELIPQLPLCKVGDAMKSKSEGFMDLNLDVFYKTGKQMEIALSHYYQHPSGDMIADPDMEIKIDHEEHAAEALSFQDFYVYQRVYIDGKVSSEKLKEDLNVFLAGWLVNCINQDHKLVKENT